MLELMTRIHHTGHGNGTIIAYNQNVKSSYFNEKPLESITLLTNTNLCSGLVSSFYNSQDYPYVIQFDSGYRDVYATTDFNVSE